LVIDEGDNRALPGIAPGVSTGCRDPATEKQLPLRPKQLRVAGCFRTEAPRFHAIEIMENLYSGNCLSRAHQISLFPIATNLLRLNKENVGRNFFLKVRHDLRQFADAGPRAGTTRVREHD
jgi:hypothetical protein